MVLYQLSIALLWLLDSWCIQQNVQNQLSRIWENILLHAFCLSSPANMATFDIITFLLLLLTSNSNHKWLVVGKAGTSLHSLSSFNCQTCNLSPNQWCRMMHFLNRACETHQCSRQLKAFTRDNPLWRSKHWLTKIPPWHMKLSMEAIYRSWPTLTQLALLPALLQRNIYTCRRY